MLKLNEWLIDYIYICCKVPTLITTLYFYFRRPDTSVVTKNSWKLLPWKPRPRNSRGSIRIFNTCQSLNDITILSTLISDNISLLQPQRFTQYILKHTSRLITLNNTIINMIPNYNIYSKLTTLGPYGRDYFVHV